MPSVAQLESGQTQILDSRTITLINAKKIIQNLEVKQKDDSILVHHMGAFNTFRITLGLPKDNLLFF